MSNNEYKEFSGKSLENVISDACKFFNVTSSKGIEYEIVDMGSSGFLGINRKPTIIRARKLFEEPVQEKAVSEPVPAPKDDVKAFEEEKKTAVKEEAPAKTAPKANIEKKAATEKSSEDAHEKSIVAFEMDSKDADSDEKDNENLEKEDPEVVIGRVRSFLDDVFKSMKMDVKCNIKFNEERYSMSVELVGDDMGILIGKRGITLDSLQYLVSLVANKGNGAYVRVKVDTENYRFRRQKTLENLARNISYKVKRSKRPVTLEPMNPYERRIIHYALQGDRYVTTHSEGEEPFRRVVVTLKKY